MRIESKTDIGVRRKDNQDNYWSARLDVDGREVGILCVCDGMGGLNDGGLASSIVVKAVRSHLLSSFDVSSLPKVLKRVNKEIFLKGNRMGTTCTILICSEGRYNVFHVGDSRCYLVRGSESKALTVDHSALVKYNITRENNEELWKKYKSSLTRCIGVTDNVDIDIYSGEYLEDDVFFVCSDGLWHFIERIQMGLEDLVSLDELINRCIQDGETDNITVGVLRV